MVLLSLDQSWLGTIGAATQGNAACVARLGNCSSHMEYGCMWPATLFLDTNHLKTSNLLLWKKGARGCIWKVESAIGEKGLVGVGSLCSPAHGCKCSVLGWCSAVPNWLRLLDSIYPGEINWEKQHLVFSLLLPGFSARLTKAQGSSQRSVLRHVVNRWLILVIKWSQALLGCGPGSHC